MLDVDFVANAPRHGYIFDRPQLRLEGNKATLEDFATIAQLSKRTAQRRAKEWLEAGIDGVSLEASTKSVSGLVYYFSPEFIELWKKGQIDDGRKRRN